MPSQPRHKLKYNREQSLFNSAIYLLIVNPLSSSCYLVNTAMQLPLTIRLPLTAPISPLFSGYAVRQLIRVPYVAKNSIYFACCLTLKSSKLTQLLISSPWRYGDKLDVAREGSYTIHLPRYFIIAIAFSFYQLLIAYSYLLSYTVRVHQYIASTLNTAMLLTAR